MLDYITNVFTDSIATKKALLDDKAMLARIGDVAALCVEALENGNRVILAGNGGSAADAQHIAAEFVSRFDFDRPGLPSMSLSTDTSIITAIGNDYGYEKLFERQIQANGRAGDVFIGISTSGSSENVLRAGRAAREMGLVTVGLTGNRDCPMESVFDITLKVPSAHTARIQECHIVIGHCICGIVEQAIFGD